MPADSSMVLASQAQGWKETRGPRIRGADQEHATQATQRRLPLSSDRTSNDPREGEKAKRTRQRFPQMKGW